MIIKVPFYFLISSNNHLHENTSKNISIYFPKITQLKLLLLKHIYLKLKIYITGKPKRLHCLYVYAYFRDLHRQIKL